MSFSYERYERQQRRLGGSSNRSPLGYWVPLIVTVAIATGGIAAWAWNERGKSSEEEEDYEEYDYYEDDERDTVSGTRGSQGPPSVAGTSSYGETVRSYSETQEQSSQNEGFVSQMRGAIRRTPSPQKMLEGASKRVSAGVAAIGRGLGSITEDKGEDFVDHERWSEEADSREHSEEDVSRQTSRGGTALTAATAAAAAGMGAFGSSSARDEGAPAHIQTRGAQRRTVAIVVSAEDSRPQGRDTEEASYHIEHTSILSHLIGHVASANVQLLILIYAPHLQSHPLTSAGAKPSRRQSSTDSFAEVTVEDNEVDPDAAEGRIISSYTSDEAPALYNALATQAAALVNHPTQIMPFTSLDSHTHMLRHLGPNLVYMQESLCGTQGEAVQQVSGWIGQCVVVIGAEGAGLVDTETEDEAQTEKRQRQRWWMDEKRVGLGKGVEVVESTRLGEDWAKRVEAR